MPQPQDRLLNVSLLAGSPAHLAYQARAGFGCRPSLNRRFFGGKTIADLVFVNHYLGGSGAWTAADTASIDAALAKAMTDNALQSVVNIMLPRGVILVDGFSPGFRPPAGTEAEHERRLRAVVQVGGEDADSRHGLGGYHGSAHVPSGGTSTAVYYAVGVYSEAGNGVPVFDQPWKNVATTFYHVLSEARTDPDVEDAIRTGDSSRLGWYSARGGEIGDIPVTEAATSVALIFTEIELADGSGAIPVQLMWSNKDEGRARRIG